MKAIRALLKDRRRRQRGSVLSAVLIMVAFLAIISGALMTELSTNFLLSDALVNRVAAEATVNSAAEVAINQLQAAPLNAPCPSLASSKLNGLTAAVSYRSCAPVVDARSPQFVSVANSSPFTVDATHAQLSSLDDFLVGDSGGTLFDYPYGQAAARWSLSLGGAVTGTPLVMPDPVNTGDYLDLIPISGTACAPASLCVSVRSDGGSTSAPGPQCTMPTTAAVVSQPAVGKSSASLAYVGDSAGNVYAFDPTSSNSCEVVGSVSVTGAVRGGPIVFGAKQDDVFVLSSSGGSSRLTPLTYSSGQGLQLSGTPLPLPWDAVSGIAIESGTLPSRLAISFAGGQVALVQIDAKSNASLIASIGLPAGVSGAPYWCHCPGSLDLIGVGAGNGSLYVLDTNLATYATYPGSLAIQTAPGADAAGDWFFGAADGRLYEVQKPNGGTTMSLAASFGSASGRISSSPVVAGCPAGICVYLGSTDGREYLVSLDARNAIVTACLSSAPPSCSGANPRLWVQVEVGVAGNHQTVHVQGWSYYSP